MKRRVTWPSALLLSSIAIGAVALAGGLGPGRHSGGSRADEAPGVVARPAADALAALQNVPTTLPPDVVSSTAAVRGAFTDPSGAGVQVVQAEEVPRVGGQAGPAPTTRPQCGVILVAGGTHVACSPKLFAQSSLLWVEATAGGPTLSERTSYAVGGLASPQVARLVAVDSAGASHQVELTNGAFYAPLTDPEIAASEVITTMEVYGASGALIETVKIH